MIQFLGQWVDPKHVLVVGPPRYCNDSCSNYIEVAVHFMFKNQPVKFYKPFKTIVPNPSVEEFLESHPPLPDDRMYQYERMWDERKHHIEIFQNMRVINLRINRVTVSKQKFTFAVPHKDRLSALQQRKVVR